MADDELVLGVPRSALPDGGAWRGVRAIEPDRLLGLVERHGSHRRRGDCEGDATWKQVIPYLVVGDHGRLFLMRRTRGGSDARLHGRWTIGVGGHVNPSDDGVAGGLAREWAEELIADWAPEPLLMGLLNDDSDPVGAVHLGLVYRVEAAGRALAVRETHKLEGGFASLEECRAVRDRMETWSALAFDHVLGR